MNTKFIVGILVVLALIVGTVLVLNRPSVSLRGMTNLNDLTVDSLTTGSVTNSGAATIGGGTSISKYQCAMATWNPPSLATSTPNGAATSTDIALSGAVLGDLCVASLTTATTSAVSVNCNISATGTSTIRVINTSLGNVDLDSGTAKVCYIH